MCDNAVTGWVTDFTAGKDTLLLAASNDEAARLAKLARDRLIERGQLAGADEIELADKNHAGVGDLVRARLNTTIPAGNGQTLANRDRLRIEGYQGTGENRKVVVVRQLEPGEWSKPFLVKEAYFTSDAELDYAGNVHVSQGRDVDTTHGVVREGMNARLFYVMATRGREANHVYTVTAPCRSGGAEQARARGSRAGAGQGSRRGAPDWRTPGRHRRGATARAGGGQRQDHGLVGIRPRRCHAEPGPDADGYRGDARGAGVPGPYPAPARHQGGVLVERGCAED